MPHIAITMIPGRDNETKTALALKMQNFLASELRIDKQFVSVSIEDIEPEHWVESMRHFPAQNMFVKPD